MGTFSYILRDTFRLLRRHWGVSLLTLLTAAAVFFLVGASFLLALNIGTIAAKIESDQVIQAFFKTQADAEKVVELLKTDSAVARLTVISPDQAMARLRAKMGAQARAVAMVGENPLPWSAEIQLHSASSISAIVRKLTAMPEIDDLVYAGKLAERLVNISSVISRGAMVILCISLLVSSLVLYNTIRIGVYSRRQEISVMLLVGATRAYVASPFMLQGMLLGFSGALLAAGMLHFSYGAVFDSVRASLPFLNLEQDLRFLLTMDQIMLGSGTAIGWLWSVLAVMRYVSRASKPL